MAKQKIDLTKGLVELNILYVDLNSLIKIALNDDKVFDDYRRLGVRIVDPRENYSDQLKNLSHLMYHTIVMKYPPNDGSPMRIFVDESTYDETRTIIIDGIIRGMAEISAPASTTKSDRFDAMCRASEWLNNEYKSIPSSLKETKEAFTAYKEDLNKLIKSSEIRQNNAANLHKGMAQLLSGIAKVHQTMITEDIGLILTTRKRTNAYRNTATFSQEELGYAFAFYYHLFDQVTDFLLEKKSYPHMIKLPRGNATLLPNHPKGRGALIAPAYEPRITGSAAVNYENGHILSDDDIETLIAHMDTTKAKKRISRGIIKQLRCKLLIKLETVNNQYDHPIRLGLGKKAMEAWFMCMLFIAPFNDSTLAMMEWNDTDEFGIDRAEKKEFRAIKYRAQNKPVRFNIPSAFIESFQKFIRLRRFVLNGNNCQYLFFGGFGNETNLTKTQQRGIYSAGIAASFSKYLDSNLPRVTSRSSRKDAGRDALSSHGLHVALSILQNNEATFLNSYNGQTAEEMASQVSTFLEDVHGIVNGNPLKSEQESAIGACKYETDPEPKTISEESPIKADCNDPKSCIFCEHFRTNPEREQIRKLQSVKYIIKNIAYPRAKDDQHYEDAMGPWLMRIDSLFKAMIEMEPEANVTIKEVEAEVFDEGMLSPYWFEWIQLLENLGRFA